MGEKPLVTKECLLGPWWPSCNPGLSSLPPVDGVFLMVCELELGLHTAASDHGQNSSCFRILVFPVVNGGTYSICFAES